MVLLAVLDLIWEGLFWLVVAKPLQLVAPLSAEHPGEYSGSSPLFYSDDR